jgi:hypothetical protein
MLNKCWIVALLWSKIALCAHFECNVALHVDTTTSANGTYEISQKSAEDIPEDQVNVTKRLSEAPNQCSEDNNTNIPDFSPTSKGKPRTYPTTLFTLPSMSIYLYLCIKSRSCNETQDAWILEIQCIVPESLSDRCSANRTGRSRVISCHSRDIGIVMLTSYNHYKDDGRDLCGVSWLRYPVCVEEFDKIAVCADRG